ncbi:MAG: M48 family metalloprotease [Roseiarcus sp.]|jgi:heat shock protein HtpX
MRVNGLYGHIRRNDAKSFALFLIFALLAELLAVSMTASILAEGAWGSSAPISAWSLMLETATRSWAHGAWIFHFTGYLCWLVIAWGFYRPILNRSLGAEPLERSSDRRLYDQVETLAIAAGLPTPKVVVIESLACNAFAFGLTPGDATIAITRGLVQTLDESELEAVLAHEIVHIRNRDTRLMAIATLCTAILFRVAWVNVACFLQPSPQWLFLALFAAKFFWSMLVILGWSCIAAGVCVVMARLAISHAREFVADAGAIELTKNPAALISALRKMSGRDEVAHVDFATQAAMISPMKPRLFSTHPPLAERIAALRRALPALAEPDAEAAPRVPLVGAAPPNAFLARHRAPAVSAPDSGAQERGFAQARRESGPDFSLLGRAGFWRALREELTALKPPGWVSHPYILAPAALVNFALVFVHFDL